MNKRIIMTTLIIAITAVGTGAFFMNNANKASNQPAKDLSVLEVEDERLARGVEGAPLTIVEYADMLCPYCAQVHSDVLPRIQSEYIDTKKAHYEIRLVAKIAPDSQRAGEGAYCAAEQGKFWEYMDTAYAETWRDYYSKDKGAEEVTIFSKAKIAQFAQRVEGLNVIPWQDCVDSGKYAAVIAKNNAKLSELEAYGTPHFLFNGQSYNGAPPYEFFQKALDAEYNKKVNEQGNA